MWQVVSVGWCGCLGCRGVMSVGSIASVVSCDVDGITAVVNVGRSIIVARM